MSHDKRPFRVMNDRLFLGAAAVIACLALWLLLLFTYALDRPMETAIIGASMNVLLTVPPVVSYFAILQLTHRRLSFPLQMGCIVMVALIWMGIQRGLIYPAFGLYPEYGENLLNFIFLSTFGICTWLAKQGFAWRHQLGEVKARQKHAELQMLGAQLAPHMLFNMTNSVYATLLEEPENAAPQFLAMNQMLRYVVDRASKPWVPLEEEVAFIDDFAKMERAKSPDRVQIDIASEGDLEAPIPPMILGTLFENAVKHGRLEDGGLNIRVQVMTGESIVLCVENRIGVPVSTTDGGMGLQNLKRRLALIYPGAHSLETRRQNEWFQARVEITP